MRIELMDRPWVKGSHIPEVFFDQIQGLN